MKVLKRAIAKLSGIRFGLKALFTATAVLGLLFAFIGVPLLRARREHQELVRIVAEEQPIVQAIERMGGKVYRSAPWPAGPRWAYDALDLRAFPVAHTVTFRNTYIT